MVELQILSKVLLDLDQLLILQHIIPEDPDVVSFLSAEFDRIVQPQINQTVAQVVQTLHLVSIQIDYGERVIQIRPDAQG